MIKFILSLPGLLSTIFKGVGLIWDFVKDASANSWEREQNEKVDKHIDDVLSSIKPDGMSDAGRPSTDKEADTKSE